MDRRTYLIIIYLENICRDDLDPGFAFSRYSTPLAGTFCVHNIHVVGQSSVSVVVDLMDVSCNHCLCGDQVRGENRRWGGGGRGRGGGAGVL